jgi:hypothetical protein
MKIIQTTWDENTKIVTTQYKGPVTAKDAVKWTKSLWDVLNQLPSNSTFKLLVDLHGFEPDNLEAHKVSKHIIPDVLTKHNLRSAYLDLFDQRPEATISSTRGIQCTAFANVHHDQNKMDDYRERIGTPNQQFFTSVDQAREWLKTAETVKPNRS